MNYLKFIVDHELTSKKFTEMKLKLVALNTDLLKTCLSLVNPVRKSVIIKFSPHELVIALAASSNILGAEPQLWCRLKITSVFDHIEIQSLRENTILLEINCDLLLQTLRDFNKANLDGLNIRLQRKESTGEAVQGVSTGRAASLALFYSNVNANSNTINHIFRIPVRILKSSMNTGILEEPRLPHIEVIARVPRTFLAVFKRLDKFKKILGNEHLVIRASIYGNEQLDFIIAEEGKYRVTITWRDKILVFKPQFDATHLGQKRHRELLPHLLLLNENEQASHEIVVRLCDWQTASRIVNTCHTVSLVLSQTDCVFECFLDDTEDATVVYYIRGIRSLYSE